MEIFTNMSAWYNPTEKVHWWFESGAPATLRKSVTLQGARTVIERMDMGDPSEIDYCSTTYDFKKGEWTTSTDPPPQSLTIETSESDELVNGSSQNGYAHRPKSSHKGHHHSR